jgi:hypothetical protein
MVKGLRKIVWASVSHLIFKKIPCLYASISMSPCFHVSSSLHVFGIPQTKNVTNGKWQCPFVCYNGNGKLQFVAANRKGIGSLFSLAGKQ